MSDALIPAPAGAIIPASPLPDPTILAGQLGAASIREYRKDITAYLTWCQEAGLPAGLPTSLVQWRSALAQHTTKSAATINRGLAAVKRLVKEGAAQGLFDADTAVRFAGVEGVKPSALRDRQRPNARTRISPEDMRRIADAPDKTTLKGKRDAALIAILAGSGLRAHEAAGLPITAIRKQGKGYVIAVLGKGAKEVEDAPMNTETYNLVMDWIAARPVLSQYIFTSFSGRGGAQRATARPMNPSSIWRTIQEYAEACDLTHIKPHDLRRFFGTNIVAKTGDIRKAQKSLRHKSIETTARYYVLDEVDPTVSEGLY